MEKEENKLFKFATKELSQDAFICWCINWINYKKEVKGDKKKENLYKMATQILDKILENEKLVEGTTFSKNYYAYNCFSKLLGKEYDDKHHPQSGGVVLRKISERLVKENILNKSNKLKNYDEKNRSRIWEKQKAINNTVSLNEEKIIELIKKVEE